MNAEDFASGTFDGRDLVLLGAGASVEAGIPAAVAATKHIVATMNAQRPYDGKILHFVCGALIAHDASDGESPFTELDVERVVTAVRLLADRRWLEVTPFVQAWHPNVEALDTEVRDHAMALDALCDLLVDEPSIAAYVPPGAEPDWDATPAEVAHKRGRVRALLMEVTQERSADGATYAELLHEMIRTLCSLMAVEPGRERYLAPLARAARRPGGLTVATLNYDCTVERACAAEDVAVHTGIAEWNDRRHWDWPGEGLRLLKLHGSIDWTWSLSENADGHMSQLHTRQLAAGEEPGSPALIFGGRDKLVAEGPFLSLLHELEAFLREADRLVIVGYSFRDGHVNEAIRHWSGQDGARTIVVIDPHWPEPLEAGSFRAELLSSLNAPGLPPRVEVRRTEASSALAQLW